MSIFVIKIIACITMILDHIKYAIPLTNNAITIYLGRIAFPLFAFVITEGYAHTKNLKKYYVRLFIFAIVSQIPFMLFRTLVSQTNLVLNIMFTLLLGLIAITIFDKIKDKFISIPLCIGVIYLGKLLNVDYSWYGVATVFILYVFKNSNILQIISFSLLTALYYYIRGLFNSLSIKTTTLYLCTILPLIFIGLYNGKLGKKMKYFFYWFYPMHLLIFYLISFCFK